MINGCKSIPIIISITDEVLVGITHPVIVIVIVHLSMIIML